MIFNRRSLARIIGVCCAAGAIAPVLAEAPQALSADDYARAEKFMPYRTAPLVWNTADDVTWLPDGTLWYRTLTSSGSRFVLFDPVKNSRQPVFDQAALARALSLSTGTTYDGAHLPFKTFELSNDGSEVTFDVSAKHWKCKLNDYQCAAEQEKIKESLSPNGKLAVFIRNYDLWIRDVTSGAERPLTTDGIKDFSYGSEHPAAEHSHGPVVLWSPDSRKVAAFQEDKRGVREMYLVTAQAGHPTLQAWKSALAGDEIITSIQRVILDVESGTAVRLQVPAEPLRSSSCHALHCGETGLADAQWSADSSKLAFVSTSRDHKNVKLRLADAGTGAVREILDESVGTFYDSDISAISHEAVNWRYLSNSDEIIWFSERDNWSHLYMYDMRTGKIRNTITTGNWNVLELLRVDEKRRMLYVTGVGREAARDPYFVHLYRIGFDGKGLTLLTPEDANHEISMSLSGDYFVDRYSKPDVPPVAVLRDARGKRVSTLEQADITGLVAAGWKPPVPISVKARDGVTDLYGLLFKPTDFDPAKKYPIIDFIYPGPQLGSVGSRHFAASRGDRQALAELGFIVIAVEGMGTPLRTKQFHDAYYGNMRDNTLPDQVAAIKQLAQRNPWIDAGRVGIYGHSGGGYAAAAAMFTYPDFFQVAVAESGNHDQRGYSDGWGEKYIGLLEHKSDGSTNYDEQDNASIAKNLKGHLLLMHGTLDDNVPPYLTLLVADALIKANKDFDLLLLPNQRHDYEDEADNYATRRRWDYFVRHLLGAEPPHEFQLHRPLGDADPSDWQWW